MKEMWDAFCAWPPLVPFLFSIVGICAVILVAMLLWLLVRRHWVGLVLLISTAVAIAPLAAIVAVLFIWASLWLAIVATILIVVVSIPWGYWIFLGMVKRNWVWTRVEQGWCKIILKMGKNPRVIGPGLHLIGVPGWHALYSRTMTFFKSTSAADGTPLAEPHKDPDISSFKTTEYSYAFPFKDEEDSHGLHLSGILAGFAVIEDYEKAFFAVSDWYSQMNTKILACHRRVIAQVSYDDDIVGRDKEDEQALETISERLWDELNFEEIGKPSIIEDLLNVCGIRVKSVELRSIDPPPDWRSTTLAPYKALREKEAAKHQAETSAILLDDTNQALQTWIKGQKDAGHEPTRAEIEAKQKELHERALAKSPGWQQIHIKGLENASTAVVGGGANAGVFVGNQGRQKDPKKGGKKTKPEDMDQDDLLNNLGK